jgi:hypothetical protein
MSFLRIIFFLSIFSCKSEGLETFQQNIFHVDTLAPKLNDSILHFKAQEAFSYCESKNMNTHYSIFIDMSVHSGYQRFVLWDHTNDSTIFQCLVSHGCCQNAWGTDFTKDKPGFSNIDGSHCSALGKYRIGERAYSQWGINIKYVLHGLETSNSNALSRYIVLHSWEAVPNAEVYPQGTPEGWGCPAISNDAMTLLDAYLQNEKNVLLWIY